jgi:hypothetical protein
MMAFTYGGKFEKRMNELSSPENIVATAGKFAELEGRYGAYSFGKFVKLTIPHPEEYANWEKDVGEIPQWIQDRLTEIISTNLKSGSPMPVVLKVGENVDTTHDLHVKTFSRNGQLYIGLHMLCPNSDLK